MKYNFFTLKNGLYKNFTSAVVVVVSCLFILKNQLESLNTNTFSVLKPIILTNFPNPFTDLTYIFISLPQKIDLPQNFQETAFAQSGEDIVTLKIFDLFGNLVRSYNFEISDSLSGKSFLVTWDGKDSQGNKVARGGYVCVLQYNNIKVIRKIGLAR